MMDGTLTTVSVFFLERCSRDSSDLYIVDTCILVYECTFVVAMLGTQLNSRFEAQEFSPFSIITLEKYVCSEQGPPNGEKKYSIKNL